MSKIRIFGVKLKQVAQLLSVVDEQVDDLHLNRQPPPDEHKSDTGEELSSGKQDLQIQKFSISATSMDWKLEQPGSWIGRYKLLSVLGEGGMGVVYLAEQQNPFKRQVALKIIKPGMDSKRVIARFEAEQQALALLEHPYVARIYDAGLTQSGRPYFVMEHVKGIPITEYCDNHKLVIEERLMLFLRICEAIQHAHQKGIIHRDIKPSNILVTSNDSEAVPKVIDFGVARALSLPLTERPLYTEQGQLVGTPEYMSPEQVELANRDIDTRTDVYSLGVLLYELLIGVLPFDRKTFRKGGVEHMRKIICEQDPKIPSIRLSGTSVEDSTELARKRQTDVQRLQNQLRGDLDWITLKAMEKDRARRYATIDAIAADIRNHLTDQPVSAAPPGTMYRAKKFARRNRQILVALGLMGLVLVGGLLIAIMSIQAARERNYAQSLEHRDLLTKAQSLAGNTRYEEAQAIVSPLLNSPHIKRQAKLLQAQILLAQKQVAAATTELKSLLDKQDEIAGQAHFLLANIYYEDDPWSPGKTKEYQAKRQYHSQQAEQLIACTAQYAFLQAKASHDVHKMLEYFSKALQTDNNHYDSLRERAYIYYAQKDYSRMGEDASQMITLRSGDPTGYLLRALARREQGRLEEAIADHDKAIACVPDDPTLYHHRGVTYIRMDQHASALADAQRAAELDPNNLHYDGIIFSLRVACGQYEQARQQYKHLLSQPGVDLEYSPFMPGVGHWNTKDFFNIITAGCTFWTLARQQSWQPPPEQIRCAPFWAMREATKFYHQLSGHARCIIEEGFSPSWSPDGTKIAYSEGTHWASAVAIFDVQTGKTEILTAPGRDPQWSGDGKTIAFVRDRQSVAMDAITPMAHVPIIERRRTQGPLSGIDEVWIINVASGKLRRIAEGSYPTWGADSRRVYFHSRGSFCSAFIDGNEPTLTTIFKQSGPFPAISPDGQYVAEADFRLLRIWDILSRKEALSWLAPPFPATGIWFNWSPDSREISIGGFPTGRVGLWILDIRTGEARRMLDGPIMTAAWSPDRSRMAIVLGPPHIEIWLVKLDPNRPTAEALGDGATVEEHCHELIEYYNRGVTADPNYIDSHLRRTDAALWIGDSRAPQFLEELERAFQCTPYHAGGCVARAQAILSSPAELRDRLLRLALLLARKAVEKEPDNVDFLMILGEVLCHVEEQGNAEVILLKAYNLSITASDTQDIRTSKVVQLLIQLYEAWNKPEKAKEWRAKLSQTDAVEE
jgi:serine/threonine protein kinase/Tol biopolymer transport system component/Flp pilus assembly protein TadD